MPPAKQRRAGRLREQFPVKSDDLTNSEFVGMFKRVLKRAGRNGQMPCTILILDEVQQYIGDSETRSVLITGDRGHLKQLDSQVIVVGAGQSALTGVKLLNKLLDRFTIRIQLSDTDVETVTRKVLLQKQPASLNNIARASLMPRWRGFPSIAGQQDRRAHGRQTVHR